MEAQELDSLRWLAPELHAAMNVEDSEDSEDDGDDKISDIKKDDNGRPHSTQSDIFSLAMTIFEVISKFLH